MKLPVFWELATYIEGIPESSIIEIFGFEATGKTSFCLYIYTKAIEQNIPAVILDTERAIRENYLHLYNLKQVNILKPNTLREVFEIIKEHPKHLILWDTLASTPASDELKEVGIASQSRELSTLLRTHNQFIKDNAIRLVIFNQARTPLTPFAEAVAPGGLSLNFYADLKIFFRRKAKNDNDTTESEMNIKKNRFGKAGGSSLIVFTGGRLDEKLSIIRNAVELKILNKKPRGYSYKNLDLSLDEVLGMINELELKIKERIEKRKKEVKANDSI